MQALGRFTIKDKDGLIVAQVPNLVTSEGIEAFLKMIARDYQTDVAGGGNFYLGICGATIGVTDTLSTLAGEPSVTNGYARQPLSRDNTGWPTISKINSIWAAQSASVTFAASGGAFSSAWYRCFLCSVGSGASGKLFSYSALLPAPITVLNGNSYQANYDLFLES